MFIKCYCKREFIKFNVREFRRCFTFENKPDLIASIFNCTLLWQFSLFWLDPKSEKKNLSHAPLCRRHMGNTKMQKRGNVSFINYSIKIVQRVIYFLCLFNKANFGLK